MVETSPPSMHWVPKSEADRELVLKELESILSSYHFRGSKRYPALLKYVVDAALQGRTGDLKERTLGVEVFGRPADYDTNADPVVRFSAGEVRKRIAQYYHENGNETRLQIELPLGSYIPEFHLCSDDWPQAQNAETAAASEIRSLVKWHRLHTFAAVGIVLVLLAIAGASWIYMRHKKTVVTVSDSDKLWAPLSSSARPTLIVVGTSHPVKLGPEPDTTSFLEHMTGPFHHVSFATAISLANLAGVLRQRGVAYEIKEDTETSLTDLRGRPVVLVGATNNAWTMRLIGGLRFHLRFHFMPGPMAQIQDAKDPQNKSWLIDFNKSYLSVSTDYAVMARYYDTTTEGPVMVIAGLGPYGTEAASSLASSPEYLAQLSKGIATGWANRNIEVVLKTDVLDSKAGPPTIVASEVW
jgi:hypothetical protein